MPWSSRIGALGVRSPKGMLVAIAIAAVAALVLALPNLDRLSGALATDPDTESARAADAIRDATGTAAEPAFFAIVRAGRGGDEDLDAQVQRIAGILEDEPRVAQVVGLDEQTAIRSEDGSRAFVSVTLDTPSGDGRTDAAMQRLIADFDEIDGVQLGGMEIVVNDITTTIREDLHKAELVIIPILLLLTLLFFRSVAAASVPVVIAGLAALLTMLALVAATYVTNISNFALNLTSALAMGLGIDYGLLLVSRFREQLAAGDDTRTAVARTMATAGRAVMFSAATVGASMASLLVFPQSFIQSIGVAGVIVAVISGLTALFVVPALLMLLGPNIDAIAPKWMQRRNDRDRTLEDGAWYRLATAVSKRAGIVMVLATLLILFLALPARDAKWITSDETVLPKDSGARLATESAKKHFPLLTGPTATIVVPDVDEDTANGIVGDARRAVTTRANVGAAIPALSDEDTMDAAALGELRNEGPGRTWTIPVLLNDRAIDDESLDIVRDLRRELPKEALVQGQGAQLLDARSSILAHTPAAVAIVVGATMLFILFLTGSIVLAVKTVIMNALTLAAMFGALTWIFQDGNLEWLLRFNSQGGLEVSEPMIICALVFGLSTDYGVFLLARVKESYDAGHDTTTALAIGTERTGRVITTAALLFCVAMGVSAATRLVTVKQVGFGVAFAVLLDATLVRGILVPATMNVLGRWNWWAPGPLKKLADRSSEH